MCSDINHWGRTSCLERSRKGSGAFAGDSGHSWRIHSDDFVHGQSIVPSISNQRWQQRKDETLCNSDGLCAGDSEESVDWSEVYCKWWQVRWNFYEGTGWDKDATTPCSAVGNAGVSRFVIHLARREPSNDEPRPLRFKYLPDDIAHTTFDAAHWCTCLCDTTDNSWYRTLLLTDRYLLLLLLLLKDLIPFV